jgi:hypothetical protein
MLYRVAADALVALHLGFIIFVIAGGFLLLRWPRLIWIHPAAAVWGTLIEFFRWTCPLTPLENRLRGLAGDAGYQGGFIEHYVIPIVYPPGLSSGLKIVLGILVILINILAYTVYFRRRRPHRS